MKGFPFLLGKLFKYIKTIIRLDGIMLLLRFERFRRGELIWQQLSFLK